MALGLHEEGGRRVERLEAIEDRWERMVLGTPWVASCTVVVEADAIESCSGPEAAEHLTHFTHVRFPQHEGERIVVHMLAELYARSAEEAAGVLEEAARGELAIASLAEEARPPASTGGESAH